MFRQTCHVCLALLITSAAAEAWHVHAHVTSTRAALRLLPSDVPVFFCRAGDAVAHHCVDPDLLRDLALPQLQAAEAGEHFIDLELLKGAPLPADRVQFITLCHELDVTPRQVGGLPYVIAEHTQRLTMAFAEYRRWPDNPHIRAKCLVRAGTLAHYAQDACQPLHVTVHYDGRTRADGSSPHTGIHFPYRCPGGPPGHRRL